MRRFALFLARLIVEARPSDTDRRAGIGLAIFAFSVFLGGSVHAQLYDTRSAQRGLRGTGPPGQFSVPRPRAGNKPQPAGYKLFEKKEMEWIGKEYLDTIRGSRFSSGGFLSPDQGASGYLDDQWKVHMILDDQEALLVRGWKPPSMKISGYDFSTMADGESLSGNSYFRVTGTDSFTDVKGQRLTVYVAEPVNTSNPPPKPVASGADVAIPYQRSWTNAKNGRSITATYYGFDTGTVSLLTSKNEVIEIPLEDLAADDKSHVSKLTRIRRDVADYNQWRKWRRPQYLVQKILD